MYKDFSKSQQKILRSYGFRVTRSNGDFTNEFSYDKRNVSMGVLIEDGYYVLSYDIYIKHAFGPCNVKCNDEDFSVFEDMIIRMKNLFKVAEKMNIKPKGKK